MELLLVQEYDTAEGKNGREIGLGAETNAGKVKHNGWMAR
jgi:hypothetical protein